MILSRKLAVLAALLTLAGCQSAKHNAAAPVDPEMDRCGASDYQQYVGKPLSAIDGVRFQHPARAVPYNSAVTMDFNLNRLNFMGDRQNVITRVYCG
ncbi:I78 family peptidase inhibitor [Kalamiella sp. sgz302252]|uniref:I78 family peptidase inhibitor n=1 Tax=Pantoea sp. sgz302252 TaxID=3341827 RepID=UPI0036D3E134